ncbi:unnamed protein product [Prorocentrum cordatum]|uniref:Uncharacterized protein n=1 Tax=Prorocentrum cordatum TaxID=2364126 RepID=A0ABN9QDL2_9DINO|nr:unnamed protein product [Polarella glacialis]
MAKTEDPSLLGASTGRHLASARDGGTPPSREGGAGARLVLDETTCSHGAAHHAGAGTEESYDRTRTRAEQTLAGTTETSATENPSGGPWPTLDPTVIPHATAPAASRTMRARAVWEPGTPIGIPQTALARVVT